MTPRFLVITNLNTDAPTQVDWVDANSKEDAITTLYEPMDALVVAEEDVSAFVLRTILVQVSPRDAEERCLA